MTRPLRLLIYDQTCTGRVALGLSSAWQIGGWLYSGLRRIDLRRGCSSWAEALGWLVEVSAGQRVREVQFWGHGGWGEARIAQDRLDTESIAKGSPLHHDLVTLRQHLTDDALFWFRTCETFGALRGQRFASCFAELLGCRVAGHTYVIGFFQSGLHSLRPKQLPSWSATEGIRRGTAADPLLAKPSHGLAPHTITCLQNKIPARY